MKPSTPLVMLAILTASSAAHAAPQEWAYLWANQPSAASYTPSTIYQRNSTGGTNTITRSSAGVYLATLPGLGADAGVVHVTAYGSGNQTCKVSSWDPSGSAQLVEIRCFDANGAPADAQFTMSYVNPITPDGAMAYLWADQPGAASYTPAGPWQFNSSGATNTVTRNGVGNYTAWLPNLGGATGHVQVTAYGTTSDRCKVHSWIPSGTTQRVFVRCFTAAGSATDTRFTLTYVSDTSLIGGSACCFPSPGPSGAYVWAHQPGAASYTPALAFQWDDFGGTNTATRAGVGTYAVQFTNHSLSSGHVQVTAYGGDAAHCKIAFWSPSAGAQVRCFDSSGNLKDSQFDIAFLDDWQGL